MIAPIENRYQELHVRPERPQSVMTREDEQSSSKLAVCREWIGERPVAALALAAVIGLSAAWLVKRRG